MNRKQISDFGTYPIKEAERIVQALDKKFPGHPVVLSPTSDYASIRSKSESVLSMEKWLRMKAFAEGVFWADYN